MHYIRLNFSNFGRLYGATCDVTPLTSHSIFLTHPTPTHSICIPSSIFILECVPCPAWLGSIWCQINTCPWLVPPLLTCSGTGAPPSGPLNGGPMSFINQIYHNLLFMLFIIIFIGSGCQNKKLLSMLIISVCLC